MNGSRGLSRFSQNQLCPVHDEISHNYPDFTSSCLCLNSSGVADDHLLNKLNLIQNPRISYQYSFSAATNINFEVYYIGPSYVVHICPVDDLTLILLLDPCIQLHAFILQDYVLNDSFQGSVAFQDSVGDQASLGWTEKEKLYKV